MRRWWEQLLAAITEEAGREATLGQKKCVFSFNSVHFPNVRCVWLLVWVPGRQTDMVTINRSSQLYRERGEDVGSDEPYVRWKYKGWLGGGGPFKLGTGRVGLGFVWLDLKDS